MCNEAWTQKKFKNNEIRPGVSANNSHKAIQLVGRFEDMRIDGHKYYKHMRCPISSLGKNEGKIDRLK